MPTLEPKDTFAIGIAFLSLIFSVIALVITYRQKNRENRQNVRKSLTDTLLLLSQANYALAQYRLEKHSAWLTNMRRQINAQKRYLVNHAALLANEIPKLTADIDHNQIAVAFDDSSDPESAKKHWQICISKSANEIIKAYNLRGFARFLFMNGDPLRAREVYEQALRVDVPENDRARNLRADTYLLWSRAERECGFLNEAQQRRNQAVAEAERIGQVSMRQWMLETIAAAWSEAEETGQPGESKPQD